ncbi:hypothetical protein AAE026_31530 [Bradyrhizobium sp. DN5]|uniref:hypothetical protein n=1 Tax=Bradyrhizobium sp. DN5 TaxID=3056950 RepID=UPI0035265022
MGKIKGRNSGAGNGSFFYDDQTAIGAGAAHDEFLYVGSPLSPDFVGIRMPSR